MRWNFFAWTFQVLIIALSFKNSASASPKEIVCIYTGKGIAEASSESLIRHLRKLKTPDKIYSITDPSSFDSFFNSKTDGGVCFIVPGGNTRELVENFSNKKDLLFSKLRKNIKDGDSYVGVCCGGNLACSRLMGEMNNNKFTFMESKDLVGLLDGDACFFSHPVTRSEAENGKMVRVAWTNEVSHLEMSPGHPFQVYWNRGSYYTNTSNNVKVLARYLDSNQQSAPSLICGKYGEGNVIACAVHPEIDREVVAKYFQPECLGPRDPEPEIRAQVQFLNHILEHAELKTDISPSNK